MNRNIKQHITVEQLKELNKDQRKVITRLLGWETFSDFSSLVTIGKMIEILGHRDEYPTITEVGLENIEWAVKLKYHTASCYNENLCDALWNTVKEVL